MVGLTKLKNKQTVYFGHPSQFWIERQRLEMKSSVNVEAMKKLADVVDYDALHLQRAKGMMCTKEDEKRLKEMQKLQMQEKKNIEKEGHNIDMLWHQVLIEDVREKEQQERAEAYRRQQEMLDRRRAYDEQIASANRKRQEAIREETEKENRRLEKMRKKMEQDHYEAIKRKKDQQKTNKANFIEGHEMKLSRLRTEKMKARDIDNGTIRAALEELQIEKEKNRIQMRNLQMEKQIFVDYQNRERKQVSAIREEADRIAEQWKRAQEEKSDEQQKMREREKMACKEEAAREYKKHIDKRNVEIEREKQERRERMERVKRTAHEELQKQLNSAKDELRRQIEYRNNLTGQIRDNQRFLESELINTELKDRPFTKKAITFKEALENTLKQKEVVRESTNPVHPFRRKIEAEESKSQLPLI